MENNLVQDIGIVESTARMEARTMTLLLAPKVSKAQLMTKKRQEEQRQKRTPGEAVAEPAREVLAPLTDQDDDWDDEEEETQA